MNIFDANAAHAARRQLAILRDELLSPVNALLGYAETVHEEASRLRQLKILPDLSRIVSAARDLTAKVDQLGGIGNHAGSLGLGADSQELRHELRTPLNAIKGYGEMLREDLAYFPSGSLRENLDCLLTATSDVLGRLDGLAQLSGGAAQMSLTSSEIAEGSVADLALSIGPVLDIISAASETGSILVVDDIEANRDLLSRRLIGDGHRVASVDGGRQALKKLAEDEFDVVLLDLMMPDINGFELLVRMKSDERLRRIPVIMITALAETKSAIRCIEAGAEDYLPKPFDPVLLRARINACLHKKRWRDRERNYLRRIEEETQKFQRLLLNILPEQVIRRLNHGEATIADRFEDVSVLFADLVGFTEHSARTAPAQLVEYLNRLYSEFDSLALALGVEKIKTIGDAYMAVAGVPEPHVDHCQVITRMALGMIDRLDDINCDVGCSLQIRIGIHSGPVVAGVIGKHRFIYDVWGDTVNMASRLEASSLPNRVHVSQDTTRHLAGAFALEPRGSIDMKGRGQLKTFFVGRP